MTKRQIARWILCGVSTVWLGGTVTMTQSRPGIPSPFVAKTPEIKSTWWVALGPDADVYNPSNMIPMKPGSFVFHPAFGHHYDMAKDEEAVVRIMGMGPVKSTNIEQPK